MNPLDQLSSAWIGVFLIINITFVIGITIRNAGIIDVLWGFSFAILAAYFSFTSEGHEYRRILLGSIAFIWASRLGIHLLIRCWKLHPKEDGRYSELRKKWGFKVDRKHPVVAALNSGLDKENKKLFGQVLTLLEETVPTEWVRVKESEDPDARRTAFEGRSENEILDIIRQFYAIYRQSDTKAMAIRKLRGLEGLGLYDELIEKVKEESK